MSSNRARAGEGRTLAVWWQAVRPFSFTASVTPVVVGSAAAFYEGEFQISLFLVSVIASVAIHAGTNLVNDYYDHVRGVDTATSLGPSGVIQQGLLQPRTVLVGGLLFFAMGAVLGLWLVAVVGWPVLVIGIVSVVAGYAYTGGPLPLGYLGLGELTVLIFMGPVIVLGAYYVQTRMVSATPLWAALPLSALVTAILVVNNLRDIEDDRDHGKRTLATALGPEGTRAEYGLLVIGAYASLLIGVLIQAIPPLTLVVLGTVPLAIRTWRIVRRETDPRILTRGGLRGTARLHLWVGVLLALAFVVTTEIL